MDTGHTVYHVNEESERRAQRLHIESTIVDTCNTAVWDEDYIVNRLVPSGVNVTVPTIASEFGYATTGTEIAGWFAMLRKFNRYLQKATSFEEVERAVAEGKVAVIYAFQSPKPLDGNLDLLEVYYELGVRVLQITYNYRGYAGDGCLERYDGGLSDWGIKLVERMNKLGMLIDLSHASPKTSVDVIEISVSPVIFSHSNCKSVVDNPRNIDNALVEKIKRTNGYIGVNVFLSMVSKDFNRTPTLDDVLNHVEHIVHIAGPEYVGFGLDRGEGMTSDMFESLNFPADSYASYSDSFDKHLVPEIRSVRQFMNLTRALVKRGYSDSEVEGILGGNFLRVLRQVVG